MTATSSPCPTSKLGAPQNLPRPTLEMNVVELQDRRGHGVCAFHRRSSRRASAASGSDIAR